MTNRRPPAASAAHPPPRAHRVRVQAAQRCSALLSAAQHGAHRPPVSHHQQSIAKLTHAGRPLTPSPPSPPSPPGPPESADATFLTVELTATELAQAALAVEAEGGGERGSVASTTQPVPLSPRPDTELLPSFGLGADADIEADRRRQTLLEALWRLPEGELRGASRVVLGPGGELHPRAILGRATTVDALTTPGALMMLEVCLATDPHAAVDALLSRRNVPPLRLSDSAPARRLLRQWAQEQAEVIHSWLHQRAAHPPPSLPPHRASDAVRLAEEARQTLKTALRLLSQDCESVGGTHGVARGESPRMPDLQSPRNSRVGCRD